MKGNITACVTSVSGETDVSVPCETDDYACKFICLQTDGLCCVSFYRLQLNVNHDLVYRNFSSEKKTSVVFKSCSQ